MFSTKVKPFQEKIKEIESPNQVTEKPPAVYSSHHTHATIHPSNDTPHKEDDVAPPYDESASPHIQGGGEPSQLKNTALSNKQQAMNEESIGDCATGSLRYDNRDGGTWQHPRELSKLLNFLYTTLELLEGIGGRRRLLVFPS